MKKILFCLGFLFFASGSLYAVDEIQQNQIAAEIQKGFDSLEPQPPPVKRAKRYKKGELIDTAALEKADLTEEKSK